MSAIDMEDAVDVIQRWVCSKQAQYVCVATVNSLIESQHDEEYRRIHNAAGLVTPDGMPLVWFSRMMGCRQVDRVCGPDLMQTICERSERTGLRHFFYGGRPGVVTRLEESLRQQYPGLTIAGTRTPEFQRGSFKYRILDRSEDDALVEEINASEPDIIWVGLGSPMQERWMAEHVRKLSGAVLIGVGAAFDFHAGVKRRAPRWMQRSGLEWAFRLLTEPRRLWRRYLVRNSWFVYLAILQILGKQPVTLSA